MDDVGVAFTGQDGKPIEKKLIEPDLEPVGGETYNGSGQPDGEWRMVKPASRALC